jgi:hypothetical protein
MCVHAHTRVFHVCVCVRTNEGAQVMSKATRVVQFKNVELSTMDWT